MEEGLIRGMKRFVRFYEREIGGLQKRRPVSPYSAVEERVIFELARVRVATASDLREALGLDAGYMSRVLSGLERSGVVERRRSAEDGRRRPISLTAGGEAAFETLDERYEERVEKLLTALTPGGRRRLVGAMATIEGVLAPDGASGGMARTVVLRMPEPGDMGWVVHRHGVLRVRERDFDETVEASVSRAVADFIEGHDPVKERCWIAEMDGEAVGCAFVVKASDGAAGLRFLLVEPGARGLGLGGRLVEECVRFARRADYEKLALRTGTASEVARRIFEKHGFEPVEEKRHDFGKGPAGQRWELAL